ncbi:hypothetical protein NEIELOOT_01011 [Neisseria elongata subsp. glycolytica ATCC 29315]|uniref:Uncharacterized protein n=1 Tax=Neisseria elongata subsp. glycolytica ATCC 29315 TaxID=546263 RepID=D4DPM4_NEIEG|nr:hypothetical protein NEIELOOT_01011 [Neisseria elongata subsp. glycolytica ATCC 29315]
MKPNSPNWVRGYLKPQRPSEKPMQAAPKPNRKKTENPFSDGLTGYLKNTAILTGRLKPTRPQQKPKHIGTPKWLFTNQA